MRSYLRTRETAANNLTYREADSRIETYSSVPGGTLVPPSEPEPPVAGVSTPAAPRIPVTQVPEKALAATGSSAETLAGGVMIVFLAGGAMMVASRRRARR